MGQPGAPRIQSYFLALIGASALMVLLLFPGTALAYGPGPPPSSTTTTSTTVVAPTTTTTVAPTTTTQAVASAGLALTGTDALEAVGLALALIALGTLLRVATRRRAN